MKKLFIFFVLVQCVACAQVKNTVVRSQGYYMTRTPGTIAVDPATNEPMAVRRDTIYMIYVETTSPGVSFDTAWKKGKPYLIQANQIENLPHKAGLRLEDGTPLLIEPSGKNVLWQLFFVPLPESPLPEGITDDSWWIRGSYKGKSFNRKTDNWIQLQTMPTV